VIPPATIGLLFDRDFDAVEHARLHAAGYRFARAGFDLFRFPSQLALPGFDLSGFAQRIARRARRGGECVCGYGGWVFHADIIGGVEGPGRAIGRLLLGGKQSFLHPRPREPKGGFTQRTEVQRLSEL
jgi:hypothetical protein